MKTYIFVLPCVLCSVRTSFDGLRCQNYACKILKLKEGKGAVIITIRQKKATSSYTTHKTSENKYIVLHNVPSYCNVTLEIRVVYYLDLLFYNFG
jgi:hypothetical protein